MQYLIFAVEDVVGAENESDNLKQYSNTVLIQVLLEFICHAFVKEENHREKLLIGKVDFLFI